MVEEVIVNLGGEPTTTWVMKDEKGMIVWSTFDKKKALHQIELFGEKKDDTKPTE